MSIQVSVTIKIISLPNLDNVLASRTTGLDFRLADPCSSDWQLRHRLRRTNSCPVKMRHRQISSETNLSTFSL
jgi:hypothetical protein